MNEELRAEAQEVIEMWDEGEYDNFKDVITDCHGLLDELPESETALRKEALRVLIESTTAAQEMVDEDPGMGDYMAGLIDPEMLSPAYRAAKKG